MLRTLITQMIWRDKEATPRIRTINFIKVIEMIIETDLNLKEYTIISLTMDTAGLVRDANTDILIVPLL